METEVLIYGQEDLKKSGGFKKKFKPNWINKTDFFKYLKDNNLNINSNYIDISGNILNINKRFRCSFNNMVIGVSGLVKEFNEMNKENKSYSIKSQENK